jgi:hypothetical protein
MRDNVSASVSTYWAALHSDPQAKLEIAPLPPPFDTADARVRIADELHLDVPLRAHRADRHTKWVDEVLSGRPEDATKETAQGMR